MFFGRVQIRRWPTQFLSLSLSSLVFLSPPVFLSICVLMHNELILFLNVFCYFFILIFIIFFFFFFLFLSFFFILERFLTCLDSNVTHSLSLFSGLSLLSSFSLYLCAYA